VKCDSCGFTKYYALYVPEKKEGWFRKAEPAKLRLECSFCGRLRYIEPGSTNFTVPGGSPDDP